MNDVLNKLKYKILVLQNNFFITGLLEELTYQIIVKIKLILKLILNLLLHPSSTLL